MVSAHLVSPKASLGLEMSVCLLAVSYMVSSLCAHPWRLCVPISSFKDTSRGGLGPTPKPHFRYTFEDHLTIITF